jgi:hypothetical protein
MKGIIFAAAAVIAWSCSPVKITRIGPPLIPQSEDCEVQIFEEGDLPNRPNRDVGMVTLDNCQDHRVPPCSKWLRRAVCEIGGSFAYPAQGAGTDAADYFPNDDLTASSAHMMTVRMMVGAYVVDLVPGPLLDAPDCEEPQEASENGGDNGGDEPQKCLE